MLGTTRRSASTAAAAVLAAAMLVSGCSGDDADKPGAATSPVTKAEFDKAMSTPTTLTFWTWLPDIKNNVALFEKKYPAIKVNVANVGNGTAEFTKIRTALKSGNGAPDVVQLSTSFVSSFVATKSLLDLVPYGANDIKDDFVPAAWNQVTSGDKVYAIPQDTGPLGFAYRTDILQQAGISNPPATWAEFATIAATVKEKTGSYLTNFAPDPEITVIPVLQQSGLRLFEYDGDKTVKVNVNSAQAKEIMSFWQKLIQADLVSVDPDFTDQWYQALASGKVASWLSPAWGPLFLQGTAKGTAGKWRAAELPQFAAGEHKSSDAGGSSNAVLNTTKYPIAAAELTKWINHDRSSTLEFATKQSLFPTAKDVLTDPQFVEQKSPFFGDQQVNKLYAEIANNVGTGVQHLPYMDFVDSSFNDTLGKAIAEKGDLAAGLDAWQDALVNYGKQQGFTVK